MRIKLNDIMSEEDFNSRSKELLKEIGYISSEKTFIFDEVKHSLEFVINSKYVDNNEIILRLQYIRQEGYYFILIQERIELDKKLSYKNLSEYFDKLLFQLFRKFQRKTAKVNDFLLYSTAKSTSDFTKEQLSDWLKRMQDE